MGQLQPELEASSRATPAQGGDLRLTFTGPPEQYVCYRSPFKTPLRDAREFNARFLLRVASLVAKDAQHLVLLGEDELAAELKKVRPANKFPKWRFTDVGLSTTLGVRTETAVRAAEQDFVARCAVKRKHEAAREAQMRSARRSALEAQARAVLGEATAIAAVLGRGGSVQALASRGYP